MMFKCLLSVTIIVHLVDFTESTFNCCGFTNQKHKSDEEDSTTRVERDWDRAALAVDSIQESSNIEKPPEKEMIPMRLLKSGASTSRILPKPMPPHLHPSPLKILSSGASTYVTPGTQIPPHLLNWDKDVKGKKCTIAKILGSNNLKFGRPKQQTNEPKPIETEMRPLVSLKPVRK